MALFGCTVLDFFQLKESFIEVRYLRPQNSRLLSLRTVVI